LSRSGAASSELVIVRWRHSPVIPTIARITMNSPLVSAVKTSVSTESSVGSDSALTSEVISSDVPSATAVSARNVRVVRSLISSARSSGLIRFPP
jgi:hypothetical protein